MSDFEVYAAKVQGEGSRFDYDGLNKYVVREVDAERPESMRGVISTIVDLGRQPQPDAEFELDPEKDDREKIEKDFAEGKSKTYIKEKKNFKTGKMEVYKCWPQDPAQGIMFYIDFPDIQLDKGQFFGDDSGNTLPLRLMLNGRAYEKPVAEGERGKWLVRPFFIKGAKSKKSGKAVYDPKHTIHKLADAAHLLDENDEFELGRVGELLGKTLNFTIQVYFRDDKYYTEDCSNPSPKSRGTADITGVPCRIINFRKEGLTIDDVKDLRADAKMTIRRAINFEGSVIAELFDEIEKTREVKAAEKVEKKTNPEKSKEDQSLAPNVEEEEVVFDDDIPF